MFTCYFLLKNLSFIKAVLAAVTTGVICYCLFIYHIHKYFMGLVHGSKITKVKHKLFMLLGNMFIAYIIYMFISLYLILVFSYHNKNH